MKVIRNRNIGILKKEAGINVDCVWLAEAKHIKVDLLDLKDKSHYSFIG